MLWAKKLPDNTEVLARPARMGEVLARLRGGLPERKVERGSSTFLSISMFSHESVARNGTQAYVCGFFFYYE